MTKSAWGRHLAAMTAMVLVGASFQVGAQSQRLLAVGVFADQYIVAGRSYDDLNALEAAVRRLDVSAVRLDACGTADPIAQRAAAHRFRDLYLELRVLARDAPVCAGYLSAYVMPAGAGSAGEPTGIDKVAVDAWWHTLMP